MDLFQAHLGHGHHGGFSALGVIAFIVGLIVWILFIVLIIVVIIYILRRIEPQKKMMDDENALDIAKRRLAAGDISKEEFDELKKQIGT